MSSNRGLAGGYNGNILRLANQTLKDLEAAGVYRKEIVYARQLPGIPQSDRPQFFNANIRPVVEQEAKLGKDEVEILKDAKARGIELPESMYKDAGVN